MAEKLALVDRQSQLSIRKQCELLSLNRSSCYLKPRTETEENLHLMGIIDKIYTDRPFLGSRRIKLTLAKQGHLVNRKRVRRLMRLMGLEVLYPKPKLSNPGEQVKKFPYLLRGVPILAPNHAWGIDITYIPVSNGYFYLVAIIDWYSRFILAWKLSNSLDISFCLEVAKSALQVGVPEIMNSDQGSQFTSPQFVELFESLSVKISWDGIGRAVDNIFVERFWRSLKYEEVYLKQYSSGKEAFEGIQKYIAWYNTERPHQALENMTPQDVFKGGFLLKENVMIKRRW